VPIDPHGLSSGTDVSKEINVLFDMDENYVGGGAITYSDYDANIYVVSAGALLNGSRLEKL
jgi:hypothetical protein